jgi:dihydrofolate synthase/folylpolyglutamate synthase
MKFGLGTISRMCEALGHPERRFQSVIIAGTNGKGSVTAMVHRALVAAGHQAARYTSPHLERLEERYVIATGEVDSTSLMGAAETVRTAIGRLQRSGRLDAPPTFFEAATAIGFVLFHQAGVKIAVLEVGLGGRLDATNVVEPIAAAITSIDLDHQAQLGDSLASIAYEKAGVIKAAIPVVCGDLAPEAEQVIREVCAEREARFIRAADCVAPDDPILRAPLALPGRHQERNARVAVCLLRELDARGIRVDDVAARAGLTAVVWPGRLEHLLVPGVAGSRVRGIAGSGGREVAGTVEVLLDAAHNPAGARALAAYLRERQWADAALVFGAMRDKDVAAMLLELAPACRAIVCTTPDTPRAADAVTVAAIAQAVPGASWQVITEPDPAAALARATAEFRHVVVAGSIFLIGPLRGILRSR